MNDNGRPYKAELKALALEVYRLSEEMNQLSGQLEAIRKDMLTLDREMTRSDLSSTVNRFMMPWLYARKLPSKKEIERFVVLIAPDNKAHQGLMRTLLEATIADCRSATGE